MLYRVSWLSHQTRPEAAGIVSLLSSRLNKATIHDLCCLNKLVHHIKGTANQPLVLHKFDLDKLVLIAASDAGGVASKPVCLEESSEELEDTVQGAWVILASDRLPSASQKTKVSILSWRSSKLKRRVSSTLAGEALSFSQALAEVEWLQLMIRDILHGDVHREDWRKSIVPFVAVLREECEPKCRLQQCHVTDAKSLFDAISKDSVGSRQDRRTAVEIAIILDALRKSRSTVRWAPHPKMIADVLTKDNIAKSNGALEEVLRTSKFSLWEEEDELLKRKENPSFKLRSKKASERTRQEGNYLLSVSSLANKNLGELISLFHQSCFVEGISSKLPLWRNLIIKSRAERPLLSLINGSLFRWKRVCILTTGNTQLYHVKFNGDHETTPVLQCIAGRRHGQGGLCDSNVLPGSYNAPWPWQAVGL